MATGKMPCERQEELFIAASAVGAPDNPFYAALDKLLRKSGFDEFAENWKGKRDAQEASRAVDGRSRGSPLTRTPKRPRSWRVGDPPGGG